MDIEVVVLSGGTATGKSTLARELARRLDCRVWSSSDFLSSGGSRADRDQLYACGLSQDGATGGAWLLDEALRARTSGEATLVIDCARSTSQLAAIRSRLGSRALHVHLVADPAVRDQRHLARRQTQATGHAAPDPAETQHGRLREMADLVMDSSHNSSAGLAVRAMSRLGPWPAERPTRGVDVVVGGQYGSEGKGKIAFHIAPGYDVLVRVGGPNAGHIVPTDPPVTHRSLPSGTLANPSAMLLIGPGAVISPEILRAEIETCRVDPDRLVIDPNAMVITGADRDAEAGMRAAIGSTAQGVGQAMARRIRDRGAGTGCLVADHPWLSKFAVETRSILDRAYRTGSRILLEGTQGQGLSLYHGTYPFVTSRDTSTAANLSEAGIPWSRVARVFNVVRTFPIRVGGNSGPMGSELEITWAEVERRGGLAEGSISERGSVSGTQRRVSEFDWDQFVRGVEYNGATDIALTFADYHAHANRGVRRGRDLDPRTVAFIDELSIVGGRPVSLVSTGPGIEDLVRLDGKVGR